MDLSYEVKRGVSLPTTLPHMDTAAGKNALPLAKCSLRPSNSLFNNPSLAKTGDADYFLSSGLLILVLYRRNLPFLNEE